MQSAKQNTVSLKTKNAAQHKSQQVAASSRGLSNTTTREGTHNKETLIMPRKRKQVNYEESESEWEAEEEESSEEPLERDESYSSEESVAPPKPKKKPAVKSPKKPPTQKQKPPPQKQKPSPQKKPKIDYTYEEMSDYEDEDDYLPTSSRKTTKGGYSHTNKSRLKISKANRGNVPWNKGKNRSETAKAKIAAGVRARNREVLLQKLQQANMTEEEYFKKKKEIKYMRERLRRAKLETRKREAARLKLPNKKKGQASPMKTEESSSAEDVSVFFCVLLSIVQYFPETSTNQQTSGVFGRRV